MNENDRVDSRVNLGQQNARVAHAVHAAFGNLEVHHGIGFQAIFEWSFTPPAAGQVHISNFGRLSGSGDRGGGDNSIQFINFGKVGDKSFKEWRQKIGGWRGG